MTVLSSILFAGSRGYDCNFEQGICTPYWNQDRNDTLDWTRRRGSTPSTATGPSVDHTLGNGRSHLFIPLELLDFILSALFQSMCGVWFENVFHLTKLFYKCSIDDTAVANLIDG